MRINKSKFLKKTSVFLLLAFTLFSFTACKNSNQNSSSNENENSGTALVSSIDTSFSDSDINWEYDEEAAVFIKLDDINTSIDGNGASANNNIITISDEGTYIITGTLTDGHIVVDAQNTDKIKLVFRSVNIKCSNFAALYIKQADKVFLTLDPDSKNTLQSGESYKLSSDEQNIDGVIFSKDDFTINGTGYLEIISNYKHAVVSKDDLVITGGIIDITSNDRGFSGKDCVKIKDGTFTLNTKGDAIESENTEDDTKGYVYIAGGTFDIASESDGIYAESAMLIDNGSFNIVTAGGSKNASSYDKAEGGRPFGDFDSRTSENSTDTISTKAIKSDSEIKINGGTFNIDSLDDALHTNASLTVAGGTFTISSGDDGIHADKDLLITGGNITINTSYEGLEGTTVTVTDGEVTLTASDDGINAANSTSSSNTATNFRGMGGGMGEYESGTYVKITGGTIKVDANGDGIDSNGDLYIEGGTTYVSGPTNDGNSTLDYAGTGKITGGTFIGTGSSGMAQNFSNDSTKCVLMYGFSNYISADTEVTLKDSSGNVLVSYTAPKQFSSIIISLSELTKGQTYTLNYGSESADITLNSVITSQGISGGMGGGNFGGGMGGDIPQGGNIPQGGDIPNMEPPNGNFNGQGTPPNGIGGTPPDGMDGQRPIRPGNMG